MRNFWKKKPHSGLFRAICEIARTMLRPWLSPESGYNYQESLDRLAEVLFLMIRMHAWY